MINKIQKKVEKVIYLYKYIDMNDNITKYVGIVSEKNRELKDRIIEHYKKDVKEHTSQLQERISLAERGGFIGFSKCTDASGKRIP
mgnify:CR=1 FL=1